MPLGLLVDLLGCKVSWHAGRCQVTHPVRGKLGVWLEDNCPVVSESDCLDLITEVEQHRAGRLQQALQIRALGLGIDLCPPPEEGELWGSDGDLTKRLNKQFPQAPDWLLLRSLPVRSAHQGVSPYHMPGLNRRARKALKKSEHIVLHLYSGKTKPVEFGLGSDVAVLNLDVLLGLDILDERVYAAAAALCATGKVDAVVGGPPCCTNSVLRERGSTGSAEGPDGGPRPVRGRTGMLRYGLPTNTVEEQSKVEEHSIMVTRLLTLHHIADQANPHGTLCAMENPDDPVTYLPESRRRDEIPSVWAWPEIRGLLEGKVSTPSGGIDVPTANGVSSSSELLGDEREHQTTWYLPRFDQGALGHVIRKPSAILTNSWALYETLHELRGPGVVGHAGLSHTSLSERIRMSGGWAKWAPGLCTAVGEAIRSWIASTIEKREEEEKEGKVMLHALTAREREFRKHCEEGHIVFRRDCRACLQGQMRSHIHRRQKHHGSNTFCLSMDLVGPWKPGKDHLLGRPATRFLLASLTVPRPTGKAGEGSGENEGEFGAEHGVGQQEVPGVEHDFQECELELPQDEEADPSQDPEDPNSDPSPQEMDRRRRQADEAWLKEAAGLQDPVPTHDLIFCEPLMSKKASEVLRAIQRIWVRILGLGLTVRRLRTDGGREFCNKQLDDWAYARDMLHTYSVPSDPKSNGRIENWVKHAKAGIRTLLCSQPRVDTTHWPSALRQWGEQRLRQSLKLLHVPDPIRPLPPFGTRVMIKNRQWSRKTPHDAKAMSGTVLCPAANIPNASVVWLDSGQFYVAPVVYQNVLDPVQFEGHVPNDIPPAPPQC